MDFSRTKFILPLLLVSVLFLLPVIHGWGVDGHATVCKIAQPRLSEAAAAAVKDLLPAYAENDLGSVCAWADRVKFRYHWSSALHYIDTPDSLCTYQFNRDCKDETGDKGRCVSGAISNYTDQLLSYGMSSPEYNLTEAVLFLSHFMGDIHQPLHVGFTSDRGANTIDVHWYTRKTVLHHLSDPHNREQLMYRVWDDNIIETAEERFYNSNIDDFVDAIQHNITGPWADQVQSWEACGRNETTCPDVYASEGIKAACTWAYKGVEEDSTLQDDYFLTRLPVVYMRLAQGGVRLAATLNRIFG